MSTTPPAERRDTPPPSAPSHPDLGVTLTTQSPLVADIHVDADEHATVTPFWNAFVSQPRVKSLLIRGIRNATRGRTPTEIHTLCETLLPDTLPTPVPFLVRRIAAGDTRAVRDLWEIVDGIGRGATPTEYMTAITPWFRFAVDAGSSRDTPDEDDHHTISPPTLTVSLSYNSFSNRRRDERTQICQLLTSLGHAFDVRVVASRYTHAWLTNTHHDSLPCVRSWRDTVHDEETTTDAIAELAPDSTHVTILDTIAQTPDNTTSYTQLFSHLPVGNSRVKQCLSTLSDLDTVSKFGPPNDKRVVITATGLEVLATIKSEFGTQSTFGEIQSGVSNPPKNSPQRREPADDRGRMCQQITDSKPHTTATTQQNTQVPYQTQFLTRSSHDGIAGCAAAQGDISVIKTDPTPWEATDRMVSYDDDRREVVISTHATTPIDYTVSNAVALASPRLLDQLVSDGVFDTLINDIPEPIVHLARQIGWAGEEALSNAESFRDLFVEVGEGVEQLTKQLKHGSFDGDRSEHVAKILRQSHGLAGSIVHALDTSDVEIIRDIRVPDGLTTSQIESLAESLSYTITIQSAYKQYSVYRQLIESREQKRKRMFTVNVDPTDNVGSFIGSLVIRGGSAPALGATLTDAIDSKDPHDDAPEISTPISVCGVGREGSAVAVTRTLRRNNLRPTRPLITVLNGLLNDPLVIANTLNRLTRDGVDAEPTWRRVRWDELRSVLTTVDTAALMPSLPSSVSSVLGVLLRAETPTLTQREVADRAGVTTQTLRNHRDQLEATGLVHTHTSGPGQAIQWRVALPTYDETTAWNTETASTATRHSYQERDDNTPRHRGERLPIPTTPTLPDTHPETETEIQTDANAWGMLAVPPSENEDAGCYSVSDQPWVRVRTRLCGWSTRYTPKEITLSPTTDTYQTALIHPPEMETPEDTPTTQTDGPIPDTQTGVDAERSDKTPIEDDVESEPHPENDRTDDIIPEPDIDFSGVTIIDS